MIDNCPVCQYSSAGLPTQHRCPECGLEYESDGVLFGEPRWVWWTGAIANALMGLTVVVHWAWRGRDTLELVLGLLFAGTALIWAWHLGRTRHSVLVSPRTIRILGREEEPEVYSMLDVGNARWSFVTGEILIERPNGTELTTIKQRFLASSVRGWKLAKTIKQLRMVAAPAELQP